LTSSSGDSPSSAATGQTATGSARLLHYGGGQPLGSPAAEGQAGPGLAPALTACGGGDSRGRRAVPLCSSLVVRLDVGGGQRPLLLRRVGRGVLVAVASLEVSVGGVLVARPAAACLGVCWRRHNGVAGGSQATSHQGCHCGVLVASSHVLRQWCVGGAVVAWPTTVFVWLFVNHAIVVWCHGRAAAHQRHLGGVASGASRLSVRHGAGVNHLPYLTSMASLGVMFLPKGGVALLREETTTRNYLICDVTILSRIK
jgi:hypothetical protein